jgi:hypothetical protein
MVEKKGMEKDTSTEVERKGQRRKVYCTRRREGEDEMDKPMPVPAGSSSSSVLGIDPKAWLVQSNRGTAYVMIESLPLFPARTLR